MAILPSQEASPDPRTIALRNLVELLSPLLMDEAKKKQQNPPQTIWPEASDCKQILSAIQDLVPTLRPENPIFASFHDGCVHDPLGGGSYAFQGGIVEPILHALTNDEILFNNRKDIFVEKQSNLKTEFVNISNQLPTRPIIIHAGAQPNNSPHTGTLVVFCYAFSIARDIRDHLQAATANTYYQYPSVSVEITFVDTAPVPGYETEIDGIRYQKSYRDVPGALNTHLADYEQVLSLLSCWSDIPFKVVFQSKFFSQPTMPSLLRYIIANHDILGPQLSPKYGKLALRASCPVPCCGMTEKHDRLNVYNEKIGRAAQPGTFDASITFFCPHHGPHTISTSEPAKIGLLEANAPTRNLIRSMSQLLDTSAHHVRITGSDYAGIYQEVFLYRPLAGWSKSTGLAAGRTPHILYAPLIVDWSGAKLSKSLYVRKGGYQSMELLGTQGLCSYAQLKAEFDGNEEVGLRRLWDEVQRWMEDPKKLFRTYSVEYLQKVIREGQAWA